MIKIQLSNPILLNVYDEDDETIEEALQTIFPLDTELAFLKWNYIYIPLSYKYDISIMITDIIRLYEFIYNKTSNHLLINWSSNTFLSTWNIYKEDNTIKVKSAWHEVSGRLKDLLNLDNEAISNVSELGGEIEKLILFIKLSLEKNGYNSDTLSDFYLLKKMGDEQE